MKDMNLCPHCGDRLDIERNSAGIIILTCYTCNVQCDWASNTNMQTAYTNFECMASSVDEISKIFKDINDWGKRFITACDEHLPKMIANRPPNKGDRQ